jgi:hypothetical protein
MSNEIYVTLCPYLPTVPIFWNIDAYYIFIEKEVVTVAQLSNLFNTFTLFPPSCEHVNKNDQPATLRSSELIRVRAL